MGGRGCLPSPLCANSTVLFHMFWRGLSEYVRVSLGVYGNGTIQRHVLKKDWPDKCVCTILRCSTRLVPLGGGMEAYRTHIELYMPGNNVIIVLR